MAFTISMTSVFAFFAFQACKNQFNIDVFMRKTGLLTDYKSQVQYFVVFYFMYKNGLANNAIFAISIAFHSMVSGF